MGCCKLLLLSFSSLVAVEVTNFFPTVSLVFILSLFEKLKKWWFFFCQENFLLLCPVHFLYKLPCERSKARKKTKANRSLYDLSSYILMDYLCFGLNWHCLYYLFVWPWSRNIKPIPGPIQVINRYGMLWYHTGSRTGSMKLQKIFSLFNGYII